MTSRYSSERAGAGQSDFSFAPDIGNRRAEFMGQIGRKLREPGKRIFEPVEHFIESQGEGSKLPRPSVGWNAFVQALRAEAPAASASFPQEAAARAW